MAKKVTDLPSLASADDDDILAVVDTSANVTKQTTVAGIASSVASSIPDDGIKAKNIDFSTLLLGSATNATTSTYTTTSFADLASLTTGSFTVPDGVTKLKISAHFTYINTNVSSGVSSELRLIDEDATVLATCTSRQTTSLASQDAGSLVALATVTPGESKTYKVQGRLGTAGTGSVGAGSLLLVEAVG
ncbi:hypothetical protein ACFZAD_24640 [Streptomyces iakyrus]|uniref:hypothetical protein n=1 Tax=Streptomyces iakyrus TaxID=68219 RepID=UPI0036E60694